MSLLEIPFIIIICDYDNKNKVKNIIKSDKIIEKNVDFFFFTDF